MSNKKLTILGLVAILTGLGAVLQSRLANIPPTSPVQANAPLIQGLATSSIATISVGKEQVATRLIRRNNRFFVANKDGYPAQTSQINYLIAQVLDIKTIELVTSNAQNHDDLEVTENKASGIVRFLDKDDKLITGVLIGKQTDSGNSYVRPLSSDNVYLTANSPWIRSLAMDYIDKVLLSINADDILSATVIDPNESYTLTSEPNSTEVTLKNMPADKQFSGTTHKQVFSALTNLQFTDVTNAASAPNDVIFNRTYVCRLKDSTVYTLAIAKSAEKTFLKCRAEFTDTEKVFKEKTVESEEQLKRKEAILLAREAVEEFNLDHKNWVYQIADFKAGNLTASRESLLKDKEEPKQAESSTEPN